MRVLGILAVASLVGCGTSGDTTIDITHDACAPLALVATSPTDIQRAGLEGGQELWRERGAPAIGLRAGSTLEVRFEGAAGAFHGLYDDEVGIIFVNRDIEDEARLRIVIAHELGHAFGLEHVPASERASVMNPGNLTIAPTEEDETALARLWGTCE